MPPKPVDPNETNWTPRAGAPAKLHPLETRAEYQRRTKRERQRRADRKRAGERRARKPSAKVEALAAKPGPATPERDPREIRDPTSSGYRIRKGSPLGVIFTLPDGSVRTAGMTSTHGQLEQEWLEAEPEDTRPAGVRIGSTTLSYDPEDTADVSRAARVLLTEPVEGVTVESLSQALRRVQRGDVLDLTPEPEPTPRPQPSRYADQDLLAR